MRIFTVLIFIFVAFDVSARPEACEALGEAAIFEVDSAASRIYVRVGKAGLLSAAGHEHVISSDDVEGCVRLSDDPAESVAYLSIPLEQLLVDAAPARRRYGLDDDVSEDAIAGTRRNMLESVLNAARYPEATVVARFIPDTNDALSVRIRLRDRESNHRVRINLQSDDTRLRVRGRLPSSHSALGIPRFTAAAGMLKVAEGLEIEFDIVATKVPQEEPQNSLANSES